MWPLSEPIRAVIYLLTFLFESSRLTLPSVWKSDESVKILSDCEVSITTTSQTMKPMTFLAHRWSNCTTLPLAHERACRPRWFDWTVDWSVGSQSTRDFLAGCVRCSSVRPQKKRINVSTHLHFPLKCHRFVPIFSVLRQSTSIMTILQFFVSIATGDKETISLFLTRPSQGQP